MVGVPLITQLPLLKRLRLLWYDSTGSVLMYKLSLNDALSLSTTSDQAKQIIAVDPFGYLYHEYRK